MDVQSIRSKTEKQLHDLLAQKRHELRELSFKASEGQLKEHRKIRTVKKNIARILTVLHSPKNQA